MKKGLLFLLGFLPFLFCISLSAQVSGQRTLIYCGKLIDPKAGQVLTEMSVIVTGNTITAVQKGYVAAGAGIK